MTLDNMNAYLEDKGFEVRRERDSLRDLYIFIIRKQVGDRTCYHRDEWKYSPHRDSQIKFLNKLIDDFYKAYGQKEETTVKMIDTDIASDAYKRMLKLHLNSVYGLDGQYTGGILKNLDDAYGPMADYFLTDIEMTRKASKMISFTIKNVIFNDPATIVFWMDGTKTVVKTQDDDIFDPEKGLAMAIAKKVYGNQGNYYNKLKKWLPEKEEDANTIEEIIKGLPKYTSEQWEGIYKRFKDSFKEDKQ